MKPSRRDLVRRLPRLGDEELVAIQSLDDEADLEGAAVTGDFAGAEYSSINLRESRLTAAVFTGSRLFRASLTDCVLADCELSGAILDDCRFERVEIHHCRLSGLQAQGSRFTDVALVDCKVDGGNFRMTVWERGELLDSNLVDSDFYGSSLQGSRIHGCDLSNAELSKCDLAGSHLQRSRLEGVRGGDSLRGTTIGSDQVIPVALALFAAIGISVDDEG